MAKIVAIDDDPSILELIKINLEMQGHKVIPVENGVRGYAVIQQEMPSLVVLDLMMPEVDGYTVAQRLRKNDATKEIPILMLTALGQSDDKVKGFDVGADDYLVKPFDIPEFQVRVRALLRRAGQLPSSSGTQEILSQGLITLIPENLEVRIDGHDKAIKLTPMEFEILNCLMQHHGQAVPLSKLLQDVWGYSPDDDVETIRVHVRHLRSKLQKAREDLQFIETIYGGGYRLHPEGFTK